MPGKSSEKKVKSKKKQIANKVSGPRAYQVIMDEQVQGLLKKRAKQVGIPIGEFVQNLLSSLEYRLDDYRKRIGFEASFRNDELDARLIKFLFINDKNRLAPADVDGKLDLIKEEFQRADFMPDVSFENGND